MNSRHLAAAASLLTAAMPAIAEIDLEFRTEKTSVLVGESVEIELYVVAESGTQSMAAADVVFTWEPSELDLLDLVTEPGVLLQSRFPAGDISGLNESVPPQDGDGYYQAWSNFGDPVVATTQGTLLATFVFEALAPTPGTLVDIVESGGTPTLNTTVLDGTVPGLDVTGLMIGVLFEIATAENPCPGDITGDNAVDVVDLLWLLGAYGQTTTGPADLDGSGVVDVMDLLILLGALGDPPVCQ